MTHFDQKKSELGKKITTLRTEFRRYSDEIGDTYYTSKTSGLHPLWESREDESLPYNAREIRDILICCPPERRISKVYYCKENTRLAESAIPEATDRRLAYIDQMYALALQYRQVLLEELVDSPSPEPTLERMLRERFDDAIRYLNKVEHPFISKEFIQECVTKLQQGNIDGLYRYFGKFTVPDDWGHEVVAYEVTKSEFYKEYSITSFWTLIQMTIKSIKDLTVVPKEHPLGEDMGFYFACLNKTTKYLEGSKIEGLDYFDLCVLGPENLDLVLAKYKCHNLFQDAWRFVISSIGKIRAVESFYEPNGRLLYELFFIEGLQKRNNFLHVLYIRDNDFQDLVYKINTGAQQL